MLDPIPSPFPFQRIPTFPVGRYTTIPTAPPSRLSYRSIPYESILTRSSRFFGYTNFTDEDPTPVSTTTLIIATPTSIPLSDGPVTTREKAATSKATAAMAGASLSPPSFLVAVADAV